MTAVGTSYLLSSAQFCNINSIFHHKGLGVIIIRQIACYTFGINCYIQILLVGFVKRHQNILLKHILGKCGTDIIGKRASAVRQDAQPDHAPLPEPYA